MQLENKYGNINLKIHEHETKILKVIQNSSITEI